MLNMLFLHYSKVFEQNNYHMKKVSKNLYTKLSQAETELSYVPVHLHQKCTQSTKPIGR